MANVTANEARGIAQNANTKSDQAVSTANQNKQEFDQLRNDFDDLVAEAGDSNPEIVQARTDTEGIKQTTLSNRLTADFSSRMSKADGIELISGQTIVAKMMDYQGKSAGNTATNPHVYYSDFTANNLKKPSAVWSEISQADYNKLASRDDSGVSTGSTANGIIPQQMSVINNVETARRLSPQLFEGLSDEDAVKFVKNNFVSYTVAVRAKVSAPNNKNLKVAIYMPASDSWNTLIQQDATDFTDFTIQINDNQYIDNSGKTYLIFYSDAANGVTASNVTIDYSGTQIRLTLNAQDILEKSGFAKSNNVVSNEKFETLEIDVNDLSDELETHKADKDNPHAVTAAQLGAVTKAELLDLTHPIGSIYQSTKSTSPAVLFGGTWQRTQGRFLVAASDTDTDFSPAKTGGTKNLVAHKHVVGESVQTAAVASGSLVASKTNYTGYHEGTLQQLPPYLSVYTWERTA